ncbi:MAG: hypothetical protein H6922_05470 [Pseudomonadaceae bacterium]|nr:hypothetical protein [Pseudomonadaceae bacterium]
MKHTVPAPTFAETLKTQGAATAWQQGVTTVAQAPSNPRAAARALLGNVFAARLAGLDQPRRDNVVALSSTKQGR